MTNSMEEQETTVTAGRSEDLVQIYTTNTVHLKKLRSDDRIAEVKGGDDWGQFTIPASIYDPLSGIKRKRKPMSADQREQAAKRLEKARAARGKS